MTTFETYRVYLIDEKIDINGVETWKTMYVGVTNDINDRWSEHQKPGNHRLAMTAAILEKGIQNFRFRVVSQGTNKREQQNRESMLIIAMDTATPNGYNTKAPRRMQQHLASLDPSPEYKKTLARRDFLRNVALAQQAAKKDK